MNSPPDVRQYILKYEPLGPLPATQDEAGLKGMDEETLLNLFKTGSDMEQEQVFNEFYRRYNRMIWGLLKGARLPDDDAADIFVDVWRFVSARLTTFEWRGKPLETWLKRITNNKLKEYYRFIKKEVHVDDIEACLNQQLALDLSNTPHPIDIAIQREADQHLESALKNLKPQTRQIIRLIYYNGKNASEIAQLLNLKPDTVRKRHERALPKLRKWLEQNGYDHE